MSGPDFEEELRKAKILGAQQEEARRLAEIERQREEERREAERLSQIDNFSQKVGVIGILERVKNSIFAGEGEIYRVKWHGYEEYFPPRYRPHSARHDVRYVTYNGYMLQREVPYYPDKPDDEAETQSIYTGLVLEYDGRRILRFGVGYDINHLSYEYSDFLPSRGQRYERAVVPGSYYHYWTAHDNLANGGDIEPYRIPQPDEDLILVSDADLSDPTLLNQARDHALKRMLDAAAFMGAYGHK